MKNIARKKVLFLILISALINVLLFPATGLAGEKITIDDGDPEFSTKGPWADSDFMGGYDYDSVRLWSLSGGTATYRPDLPRDGSYEVSGHWPSWGQFSNVPYVIHHKDGKTTVRANQKIDVYKFVSLGTFNFKKGTSGYVVIDGSSLGSGYVYADAVRFIYKGPFVYNKAPVLNSIGNKSINEGSTLQFTISASDPDGDSLTYSASNLPSGASFSSSSRRFSWTPGYDQAGTYKNIRFKVSDGALTDSEKITITVNNISLNQPPEITITSPQDGDTVSGTITITVDATDDRGIQEVRYNAGTTHIGTTSTYPYSLTWDTTGLPVNNTYVLGATVIDTDGVEGWGSILINVQNATLNQPPTATASANPMTGKVPLDVQFTGAGADSDGTIASYSWEFGDGNTSTQQNPTHTYNTEGTYTATLTVTDDDGATGTSSVVISVTTTDLPPGDGQIPHLMRFQGRITDTAGSPLDGTYSMTFRIYDAETGGNLLWQETQPEVPISESVFSVLLGSITALDLNFDKDYWLSMEVDNNGEMSLRQRITSVAYAYRAETVNRGSLVYTGGIIEAGMPVNVYLHLDAPPKSIKLYLWGEYAHFDYPDDVRILINGVDMTETLLSQANQNWDRTESAFGDGTLAHPLVSGANGVTGTGEIELTSVINWSAGEHKLTFSQSGLNNGRVRYNIYVKP